MAKTELTETKPAVREIPQIKPNAVTLDCAGTKMRRFVVEMPDSLTLQDVMDHPEVFQLVQGTHGKSLAEDDEVWLRWFNKRVFALVDWADSSGIGLCKPVPYEKRDRSRTPYKDENFEVRWAPEGGWTYWRASDGVRMSNSSWHSWEAARAALIREQYPAKVA